MSESNGNFKVLGVDLAAQDKKTAVCEITISCEEGTRVEAPTVGLDDERLLDRFSSVDKVAIDAPFGWPRAFVDALARGYDRNWPDDEDSAHGYRYLNLRLRATDRHLRTKHRITPLSVSSDKIGAIAMRAAYLLSRASQQPHCRGDVDRSGRTGRFVEVYPAAALKQWGLKARGYKGDHSTARREILKGLSQHLDLAEAVRNACIDHDDKLDALVSAIIALMAELDRGPDPKDERRLTEPLPDKEEEKSLAEKEGWIVLPKEDSLGRLRSRLQELR